MTMNYSPWSESEIWLFLRVAVSLKLERPHPPKLVYMHVTSMPTCMNFLSRFQLIKFFNDHEQLMVRKGNLAVLRVAVSLKPEETRPPKLMYMTNTLKTVNMYVAEPKNTVTQQKAKLKCKKIIKTDHANLPYSALM